MRIVLSTLRCPAGISPQNREIVRGTVSIGRGNECDWVLPDPGRVLSKRHCLVAWQDACWLVTDTSSNGTLLNASPLDAGVPRALRDGDRIAFGAYEIEARLDEAAWNASEPPPAWSGHQSLSDEPGRDERLTGDPFLRLIGEQAADALPGIGLPRDFDPLGDRMLFDQQPDAFPDHTPDLQEHFRAPRPSLELLPEDWDQGTMQAEVPTIETSTAETPTAETPTAETMAGSPVGSSAPSPPITPRTPTSPPAVASAADPAGTSHGFAAFAAGAGIAGEPRLDPDAALGELGAAFRATVSGLRRMMIARATIKGEFRIEQTMIRAFGNNPLKFAADDDDALAALLGIGRQGGMSAERAIAESLRDMRLHELAVTHAMQRAIRDMLGALSPTKLMRELPASSGDAFPGRRRQRGWDAYEALHARTLQALTDDFDSLFGKSFMRAYEAAFAELAASDNDDADGQKPQRSGRTT